MVTHNLAKETPPIQAIIVSYYLPLLTLTHSSAAFILSSLVIDRPSPVVPLAVNINDNAVILTHGINTYAVVYTLHICTLSVTV